MKIRIAIREYLKCYLELCPHYNAVSMRIQFTLTSIRIQAASNCHGYLCPGDFGPRPRSKYGQAVKGRISATFGQRSRRVEPIIANLITRGYPKSRGQCCKSVQSNGQGPFWAVKQFDRGRSCEYRANWSDHPL